MNHIENRPYRAIRVRRIIACCTAVAVALAMLGGCSRSPFFNPLNMEGYEVLENSSARPQPSDFQSTVFELYPNSNNVVIATLEQDDSPLATFKVVETLVGDMEIDTEFNAFYQLDDESPRPIVGAEYLLFVYYDKNETSATKYRLNFNQSGWLRINSDIVAPSSQDTYYLLDNMEKYIKSIHSKTILPTKFLYYRALEDLVTNSAYIFECQVDEISEPMSESFFLRDTRMEKDAQDTGCRVKVSVTRNIKGTFQDERSIIMTDLQLRHTIEEATYKSVSYSSEDIPPLEVGQTYVFFCIDPPSGTLSDYALWINGIQGYVPVIDDNTFPVQTNAAFTTEINIEDLVMDIKGFVDGNSQSVQYDIG